MVSEKEPDELLNNVVPAKMRVAGSRKDFEDSVAQFQDGDVESAAAEVIDGNGSLVFLVEAVGQGSRSRFIDDPQHVEPCNSAGVFCCLALCVVELRRD